MQEITYLMAKKSKLQDKKGDWHEFIRKLYKENTLYNTDGMKLNLCMESKSNKDLWILSGPEGSSNK